MSEALANGAHALVGGKRSDVQGAFFEPTVLVDVDQSMSCMREETFGPTLPMMKVQDVEEAIRLANDSSYGLSASVWTRDRARGEQIARCLEVGAVNVNDMFANAVAFPCLGAAGRSPASAPGSVAHGSGRARQAAPAATAPSSAAVASTGRSRLTPSRV